MNKNITTTKKGVGIILFLYVAGISVAAYGIGTADSLVIGFAFGLLAIGVIIALFASFKTAGWMGMTKERTS